MKIPYSYLLLGPTAMFALGFLSNAVVIAANQGSMPVLVPGGCTPGMISEIHSCMVHSTHLKFLADWILVRGLGIASPGDFLEWGAYASFWPALTTWVGFIIKDFSKKF